jgi:regulator of protease activity HflC (stomatin/prohibitin superfamily)
VNVATFLAILLFVGAAGIAAVMYRRSKIVVQEGHTGLLYRDGRLVRELPPGGYFEPVLFTERHLRLVPTTPCAEGPFMVEAMSQDRFAFRISVAVIAEITEPRAWAAHNPIGARAFPPAGFGAQFPLLSNSLPALVAANVARHPLDALLAKPDLAIEGLAAELAAYVPGGRVTQALVTAIVLPPELRKMLSEVERARLEGLASLERARGEQAAMRALANAARLLDNNPNLAQLRLLQVMENAKGQKSFVLGGPRSHPSPLLADGAEE